MHDGESRVRRVSLAEVARQAGTSHSAASRSLNGRPGVRPDVREAVLKAAKDLNYVPNAAARNLVMQRTGLIALVAAHPQVVVGVTWFAELVASITARLDEDDYRTVLLLPHFGRERKLADMVRPGRYDAAIVLGHTVGDGVLDALARSGIPAVTLGRPRDHPTVSYVDLDNVSAARTATAHLIEAGSTRPAMLACGPATTWGPDRVHGFTAALSAAGLDEDHALIEWCTFSLDGGLAGMKALLDRCPDIDALLVACETLLPGAMAALAEAGRRVPDDITLVSFDEGPRLAFASPAVTAVGQPLMHFGSELARLVVEAVANPSVRLTTQFPSELTVRASSRR